MALTKVTDEMTVGFGSIATQDANSVSITGGSVSGVSLSASLNTMAVSAGVGITGAAETFKVSQSRDGDIINTKILIDLTGLNSGGTAGDIIGADGSGVAYFAQVTSAGSGTIFGVKMTCIETPAGGDDDIDIYSAVEGTGVEDFAIATLTETQIVNSGTLSAGSVVYGSDVANNEYLYLVGQGTSNSTYTAGRLIIELMGYV